jgi:chromosome segregation ATPase
MRERDVLKKNLQKSSTTTKKQLNLVKVHEQTRRNLEQEISSYKEEASKQRKIIYQLEKERDKFIFEASAVQSTLMGELDQVRAKENEIFEYKKKIVELETKLKQQQNLYEAVRADRNLYSKNLIESQDEVNEMKRKLKVMNHQIDQLKEEIQNKEGALVKEHFEHLKVEKEKEALKNELQKLKQQNDMAQHYIQSQVFAKKSRKAQQSVANGGAQAATHHCRGRRGACSPKEGIRGGHSGA